MQKKLGIVPLVLVTASTVVMVLVAGCGRTPPPEFWTWTAEDSTKIAAVTEEWKAKLMSDFDDDTTLSEIINTIPETTRKALHKDMLDNRFRQRYFPGTFSRNFAVHTIEDSLILTKDTTFTVKLKESFEGTVTIRTDSATRFLKDTIINGMPFKYYDSVFSAIDTAIEVPVAGVSERELFLEPNDKVNRTEWIMKRLTGIGRYFSPDASSGPMIGAMRLLTNTGRDDTLVGRPDTLHYGAQRLYSKDSLLTYAVGESITVAMMASPLLGQLWWDPADIWLFLHIGHARRNVRIYPNPPQTTIVFADTGLKQIYIEVVPRKQLTEITSNFSSAIWAIPIRIKP